MNCSTVLSASKLARLKLAHLKLVFSAPLLSVLDNGRSGLEDLSNSGLLLGCLQNLEKGKLAAFCSYYMGIDTVDNLATTNISNNNKTTAR